MNPFSVLKIKNGLKLLTKESLGGSEALGTLSLGALMAFFIKSFEFYTVLVLFRYLWYFTEFQIFQI